MKIRDGFISNSSSTSFCIIGTNWGIDELVEESGAKDENTYCGHCKTEHIDFYTYNKLNDDDTIAGIDASPLLEKMSIPAAKKYFQKYIKEKFNITVPIEQIKFTYDERGNE